MFITTSCYFIYQSERQTDEGIHSHSQTHIQLQMKIYQPQQTKE